MEPADRAAALNIIHNFGQMPKQVTVVDVLDCVHVCVTVNEVGSYGWCVAVFACVCAVE